MLTKLREMGMLPAGWHFGSGETPSSPAIETAVGLWATFKNPLLPGDVFPGEDGSVLLVFYRDDRCVELTIDPQGLVRNLGIERGRGFDFEAVAQLSNPSRADIQTALECLAGQADYDQNA